MNWKLLALLPLVAAISWQGNLSQFNEAKLFEEPPVAATNFWIESILYNPAVHKKQLSRNAVQATAFRSNRQLHFSIHFRKQQLHGGWETFYNSGQRCDSGSLVKNLPNGVWKTWSPNGHLKSIRQYSAEKYNYIQADLRRNHPRQQQHTITRLGNVRAARYFQPQYGDLKNVRQPLLQTIKHNTSDSTTYYQPPFRACLHHGLFVNYAANGTISDSGEYVNGLHHGLWKERRKDGYATGLYNHGLRQGHWKHYDSTARLLYTEQYNRSGTRTTWFYPKK